MNRSRKYTDEQLKSVVPECFSLAQALKMLGMKAAGGNYQYIKSHIARLRIDTSHFLGQGHLRGKTHNWSTRTPLSDILVRDSAYTSTNKLRLRLIKEGIFERRCYCCDRAEWQEQPIPLELHHINGEVRDNRLSNLSVICPNCHALTLTYRGKNIGNVRV